LIYVSGLADPSETPYNGAYYLITTMSYHSKNIYKHISSNYFVWYCDGDWGFEDNRWIISSGVLNPGHTAFSPGGTDFHWYSPVDSVTVYLGDYDNDGTVGTAVVSQA